MAIGSISNGDSGSSCRSKINQGLSLFDGLIGVIVAFGGSVAPSKWILCDGSAISRADYSELFSIIGTAYGAGNGTTTFNVPDLKGRIPVGKSNSGVFQSLGDAVGEETHTLIEDELPVIPSHAHGLNAGTNTVSVLSGGDYYVPDAMSGGASTLDEGGFGGGNSHNNIQPSLVVNYIIYSGV
jgi:microcystin-dependent protein